MYKRELTKPDGRALSLYSDRPISETIQASMPRGEPVVGNPHLRWQPLRQEWVAYASHRQNRTFLPPKEYNPLAPSSSDEFPTELPQGDYSVAVFDNLFASFKLEASDPPELIVPTDPAQGHCEVVVFTQNPDSSLAQLKVHQIKLLIDVWADRYRVIGQNKKIQYVLPFENKGVEVGVTLHHPHGQIYAYPFVPPIPERMGQSQLKHYQNTGRGLLTDLMNDEINDGRRMVFCGDSTVAFVPVCARYPYEVWICPQRRASSLIGLEPDERYDLARTLKAVLLKYDQLWNRSFPYLMCLYGAPTDGEPHPEWDFHIEIYPPYRSRDRLKFLAGTELGAGLFVNDSLPEEKARELREVEVELG